MATGVDGAVKRAGSGAAQDKDRRRWSWWSKVFISVRKCRGALGVMGLIRGQ